MKIIKVMQNLRIQLLIGASCKNNNNNIARSYFNFQISFRYAPDGFAIGCAEGRVAITYFDTNARKQVDPKKSSSVSFDPNFAFKCHRVEYKSDNEKKVIDGKQVAADAYTINFIRFHPEFQTLITAGADGKYVFWDKDHRTRLGPNMTNNQKYEFPLPLTAGDVSADGKFMIFATGY